VSVSGSITAIAGAIAILAAARAVQLALRLDDERAARLSRALVAHGAAVLVVGASAVLGGLRWTTAVLVVLATGAWGFAWILIGRSYDPGEDPAERERRLAALRREERLARQTPRFERPAEAPERKSDGAPQRTPSPRRTR
jgi:hypothetical protein